MILVPGRCMGKACFLGEARVCWGLAQLRGDSLLPAVPQAYVKPQVSLTKAGGVSEEVLQAWQQPEASDELPSWRRG